jgi:hypothetical protein
VIAQYQPSAGLLVLDAAALTAVIDHTRGRRIEPPSRRALDGAGLLVDGELDAPLRPLVAALEADGPRLRVMSRRRGRLTITDGAVHAGAVGDGSGSSDGNGRDATGRRGSGSDSAVVIIRPPGSPALHLRHLTTGALARHVARLVGLGPHLAADDALPQALDLRDWAVVRSGFETPTPSGWVGRRRRAELHEVRWARSPGTAAGTALVVARLDDGLAEVRPHDAGDGTFRVTAADPRSLWSRLCALASPVTT